MPIPFDLTAAKKGERLRVIGATDTYAVYKYITGPDPSGVVVIRDEETELLSAVHMADLEMAPLCWVEGKPVYAGDRLYHLGVNGWITAHSMSKHSDAPALLEGDNSAGYYISFLRWNEPNPVIATVEGKPVRSGDVLYSSFFQRTFTVGRVLKDCDDRPVYLTATDIGPEANTRIANCSWTVPVQREGWVCLKKSVGDSGIFNSLSDVMVRNCAIFDNYEDALRFKNAMGDVFTICHIKWEDSRPIDEAE